MANFPIRMTPYMSKQEKYMMCKFPLAFQIDGASIVALLLVKNFGEKASL